MGGRYSNRRVIRVKYSLALDLGLTCETQLCHNQNSCGFIFPEGMAYTPKSEGQSVVKEVVDTINDLGIFPSDHDFLCRVAWVESKYGEARGTYRSGYHGGIWQVRRINPHGAELSKHLT